MCAHRRGVYILDHGRSQPRHPGPSHVLPNLDAVSDVDTVAIANQPANACGYGDDIANAIADRCASCSPIINALVASNSTSHA
jgi:hypothetical protein